MIFDWLFKRKIHEHVWGENHYFSESDGLICSSCNKCVKKCKICKALKCGCGILK